MLLLLNFKKKKVSTPNKELEILLVAIVWGHQSIGPGQAATSPGLGHQLSFGNLLLLTYLLFRPLSYPWSLIVLRFLTNLCLSGTFLDCTPLSTFCAYLLK